jgi:hypothetical protein
MIGGGWGSQKINLKGNAIRQRIAMTLTLINEIIVNL